MSLSGTNLLLLSCILHTGTVCLILSKFFTQYPSIPPHISLFQLICPHSLHFDSRFAFPESVEFQFIHLAFGPAQLTFMFHVLVIMFILELWTSIKNALLDWTYMIVPCHRIIPKPVQIVVPHFVYFLLFKHHYHFSSILLLHDLVHIFSIVSKSVQFS